MDTNILVHPILIDAKNRVIVGREENSWEVALACLAGGSAFVIAEKWQSHVQGFWGVYLGWVWQGWMGWDQLHSAIVSGFFGQVDLLNGKIRRFELVGMGEDHTGGGNLFKLCPGFLVRFLDLVGLCREFRTVVQSGRLVIAQIGVIWVGVACFITGHWPEITFAISVKLWFRSKTVYWSYAVCTRFSAPNFLVQQFWGLVVLAVA